MSSPHGISSNPYHVQEFYLEEFYEIMNENFRDIKLYAQEYTSIIIRMGGKLLSLFPKERELKDLVKRAIWRKGYTTVSKFDIAPSNSKKYQVFPFKKSLFARPAIIISVAKK